MSIKQNIFYNILLNISNVAFPIITVPYVSRVLLVENIGIVNFVTNYASYFVMFAMLGIPTYGMREIAKRNDDFKACSKIFSELFSISVFSTLIAVVVYVATIFMFDTLRAEWEYLLIAGAAVLFVPFGIDWFFTGRENLKFTTIRSLVVKVISVVGLFIFVRTKEDLIPYLIFNLIATIAGQMWTFIYLIRYEVRISFKDLSLKPHLKPTIILFLSTIAISIYTVLDTVMLGFLSDYSQVGYYSSAIKISRMVLPIVTAMSPVIMSRMNVCRGSGRMDDIPPLLSRSFDFMMILAVPVALGLVLIAPRFVPFFFGPDFVPATISMQLLSSLVLIIGINNLFGVQALLGMGADKKFTIAVSVGTVTNFTLNWFVIPRWGSVGASYSSVVAEILVTVCVILFSLKVVRIKISWKSLFQVLISSALLIPISMLCDCLFSDNWSYLLGTLAGAGVLYGVMMMVVFRNPVALSVIQPVLNKFIKR